jgi:two-component system response regulator
MPPVILLVEDNDDDAELTARAFAEAQIENPLQHVRDGVEALDYLFCRGQYAARKASDLPAVVLLDLALPRLGGIEVLKAIRSESVTRHLPVVILTSSNESRDRLSAYGENANSYVQKPVNYIEFVAAARQLGQYWVGLNQPAPPREA